MEAAPFSDRKQPTREPVAILLVEDDRQFAELVRAQLRRMPWVNSRLEVAGSVAAALERMAAEPFGLVITDLNLPDSRELDTLAALIAAGEQPVIVLTGDSNPALRAGALAAGAYDFLSKDNLSAAALERLVRLASIQSGTYRQVQESEQRFRALVKLSSEFYWESDAEHRVVKLEHGEERHPAVNPLQLGRARWELPSTWPDAGGWAAHRAALEAHLPFRDFEIARLDADGQENWRSISGEPVLDARGVFQGYRGIGRDLTGHKHAQEALRRFRLAMDESADMIVLIDRASMRFIDVNRTACIQLGYTRDELLALGPQDVLPIARSGLERAYDELIADPARHSGMNSQYRCKDGSLLPFESTRHVLRSGSGWIIAAISRDIRPRIAAEKAMRESEARFRSLTALSSDWYWEQDAEFRLTFMSTIERLGLDAARYLGRRRWDQPALNLSEADWAQHRAQLERREPFHDFEVERPDDQGGSVWLSLSGEPVYDPAGRFAGYRGVGRDITRRKRDERLKRMEHAVTRCLADADSASMALQGVLRAICETEKWDCGRYLAIDETAGVLRFGEGWSAPGSGLETLVEAARAVTYAPGDGIAGQVWQTGEPLWVPDVQHGPSVTQRVFGPASGIRGAFAFPASAGGRPVGVLIFNARQVRAPVERLLQATRVIGSQVGQFLQRKRAEELSQGLSSMYVALGAANEAILRAATPDEVFERVCQIAVDAGGFLIGTVFLVEGRTRRLKRVAASGVAAARVEGPAPEIDESQTGGRGLIGLACRTGEPAISNDYQADERVTGRGMNARGFETGSGAVFPLRVEGELAGVFAVQHAERNVFTGELTGLLQRLADNIAFALENFRGEARRRKAKRRLSESEQRFRSLTQLSADVYWEQDEQYRFTAFTDNVRRRNEVAPSATLGKRRWELEHVNMTPADWQRHVAQLDARQPFHDLELCHIVDGRRQWISTSGEPVFDGDRFKGYRGIVKDITERKRAEELRGLEHSVTRSLAEANGVDEALRGAIRALCLTEGWECGRYFSADTRAGRLRFSVGWSVDDEAVQRFVAGSAGFSFAPGEGLAGRVWQDGKPLWVSDIHDEGRVMYATLAREAGIRGAFVFPVIGDGRTIGVLGFSSRRSRPPDEALLQAIQVIGSQIGQFLQRKRAEQEVRESETRFRGLTELSNDWYWEQDAQFRFVTFEGRGGDPGYAPAGTVLGKRVWELPGVELGSADWDALQGAMHRHESFRNFAYSYRDQKGARYHVSADGEPVFDAAGHFAGYRGTSRDVTQQRRDDEELRRFRAAMDMSLDAIYLTDRSTMRFVDVNAAACRGVGYSREQLLGMGPHDLLRTPREVLEQEYDAVIAQGERGLRSETSYAAGDGRIGWTELHRRALRTGDGWVIVSVSRDISERKAAEERQARHLRHQERIARFGQSALAKRRPSELIDEAVQNVLEGLDVDAVAYLERGANERELVVRALVGAPAGGEGSFVADPGHPALRALESGEVRATAELAMPLPWGAGLRAAALVPVRGERAARGVLCIASREAQPFAAESLNFAEAAASVLSAGLQRIDSEGRLAYLAQFDSLTGLPNRALLADRFSQMIEIARRHGSALSVLFVDLDEFKMVNDTLGHAGGDELLKEVAVRLQGCVRSGDTVARISGDEFAVILADMARPEDAAIVAQKIIDRLAAGFDIHGQEAFVTASIGIAAYPADGADAESLIGAADAAMYRAKQAGRNAFQFFTSEINQRTRARAQLGVELRRALEREEFVVFYQPKVDLASGTLRGAEALLRWKHPERGLVSPAEFIPVLEETGLIVPVGEWVLRRACDDLKAWRAAGLAGGPVAVNLSARQFRLQDLHTRIAALVQSAGIDPALIELEITESQLMQDPDHAIRVMRALRDAGMRIAIDDFGTGYSSLSYLTRFPVGALKIDRSFVADVTDDPQDAAIVRTIIEMAHTLGFTVIAEGIETEAQAKYLREHGCEQAQGYLFARPMPAAELAQRLAAAK